MFFGRSSGGVQWLVVFLGNPGPRYDFTRHNAGFLAADALAARHQIKINRLKCRALTERCSLGGVNVLLAKPQTYMNLSGEAVRPLADYYKIPPERVLVVSDEVALPVGKLRLRPGGSAGGHNGLKSIIHTLGTDQFPRLRIGVGAPPHPEYDMADWVLSTVQGHDAQEIRLAASRAAEAVECCVTQGLDKAMNLYNG